MTDQASSSNEVRRFVRRILETSASIVLGALGALRTPSLLMRALVVGVVLAAPLAAGLWVAERVLALGPRDAPLSELMLSLVRLSLWARGMDVLRPVAFALAAPFTWSLALAAQGRRAPPRSYVGYTIRTIVRIALVAAVKSTRYLPDALLVLVFLDHVLDAPLASRGFAFAARARIAHAHPTACAALLLVFETFSHLWSVLLSSLPIGTIVVAVWLGATVSWGLYLVGVERLCERIAPPLPADESSAAPDEMRDPTT